MNLLQARQIAETVKDDFDPDTRSSMNQNINYERRLEECRLNTLTDPADKGESIKIIEALKEAELSLQR